MNVYNRAPIAVARGDGVWLTDVDGRQYLDCVAGIATGENCVRLLPSLLITQDEIAEAVSRLELTCQAALARAEAA